MWGTIYDRSAGLYPQAAHCLKQLKAAHKTIVLTTNAARLGRNELQIQLGNKSHCVPHDHLVTAGDVLRSLVLREDEGRGKIGTCYFTLGHPRNSGLLDDLGLTEVHDIDDASLVVVAGLAGGDNAESFEDESYLETKLVLSKALSRNIPLFVSKTDWLTITAEGKPWIGPGSLVEWYRSHGGFVEVVGKPSQVYYSSLMCLFDSPPSCVLAIGDHRETDIAGGVAMGFHTLLIREGIEKRIVDKSLLPNLLPHSVDQPVITPTFESDFLVW